MNKQKNNARRDRPEWAARLEAARIMAGWQKPIEFARFMEFSQQRYSGYEQGRTEPDFITLVRICDELNISLDFLIAEPMRIKKERRHARLSVVSQGAPPKNR